MRHTPIIDLVDDALGNIDRERARLKKEYDQAMAKLAADERDVLGMTTEPDPGLEE